MTSIGIPMIWMGEEIGEFVHDDLSSIVEANDRCICRYKEKTPDIAKVDWLLIADREDHANRLNKNLLQFYRGLVLLRKENKAFFQTTLEFIHEDHNAKVLAYQRWYEKKENRLNFSNQCPFL